MWNYMILIWEELSKVNELIDLLWENSRLYIAISQMSRCQFRYYTKCQDVDWA